MMGTKVRSFAPLPHDLSLEEGGYRLAKHNGAQDAESYVHLPSTFLIRGHRSRSMVPP